MSAPSSSMSDSQEKKTGDTRNASNPWFSKKNGADEKIDDIPRGSIGRGVGRGKIFDRFPSRGGSNRSFGRGQLTRKEENSTPLQQLPSQQAQQFRDRSSQLRKDKEGGKPQLGVSANIFAALGEQED